MTAVADIMREDFDRDYRAGFIARTQGLIDSRVDSSYPFGDAFLVFRERKVLWKQPILMGGRELTVTSPEAAYRFMADTFSVLDVGDLADFEVDVKRYCDGQV